MDISTKKVYRETLAITHEYVEQDHLVETEERIADASIQYKAYTNHDEIEIPVVDASVIEHLKSKEDSLRRTHLKLDSDSSTYFTDMFQYYVVNNLYPATNFFKGPSNSSTDDGDGEDDIVENTITVFDTKNNSIILTKKVKNGDEIGEILPPSQNPVFSGWIYKSCGMENSDVWLLTESGWFDFENAKDAGIIKIENNTAYWVYNQDLTLYTIWWEDTTINLKK